MNCIVTRRAITGQNDAFLYDLFKQYGVRPLLTFRAPPG